MRIGIDFTPGIAQGAGIGRYARSLVAALAGIVEPDQLVLFTNEAPGPQWKLPQATHIQARVVNLPRLPQVWHRLRAPIPVELFTGKLDVFHGLDYSLPPALRARRVVTIHDLAFITHPECAVPSLARYLHRVVPHAVRSADRVVADSQRTADDLVERLGVPRDKISVIYLGVDPAYAPIHDPARLADADARYALRHPLVLAVGTIEPRKNYARLIEAFARASRASDGPAMLAIAGRKGWLYEGVFEAAERYGVSDRVRFLHYVPEDDLPALYATADVLAMPSLYEGFGIPVLEAMATGTCVVCSDGGSLPEVAGDAALIVLPEDVASLADALSRVVRDAGLRASLAARGLERAKRFSWEATARAQLAVYHSVMG
jgi:glycosyltransferase involved in cell wall biosynthesis